MWYLARRTAIRTFKGSEGEQMTEETECKVGMAIMAHPDDSEFGSAGTIAKWIREGWTFYYVICTDGGGGGPDDAVDCELPARRELSKMRKAEQRAAGRVLGLADIFFLDQLDGQLANTPELRRELVRLIRRFRPSRVICPSPDRLWSPEYHVRRHHPDHLACGEAALAALYPAAQNPWDFPELLSQGLEPHKVSEFYVVGAPVINYAEEVSETIDIKIAALAEHQSQVGDRIDQLGEMLRNGAKERGKEHGLKMAEVFNRIENT
jgi:LmbE family N-acetylglucosaminyl deacetylase